MVSWVERDERYGVRVALRGNHSILHCESGI